MTIYDFYNDAVSSYIIAMYISVFLFLGSNLEDSGLNDHSAAGVPRILFSLNFLAHAVLIREFFFSKYFNFVAL